MVCPCRETGAFFYVLVARAINAPRGPAGNDYPGRLTRARLRQLAFNGLTSRIVRRQYIQQLLQCRNRLRVIFATQRAQRQQFQYRQIVRLPLMQFAQQQFCHPVSYTHLTLPTIA